MEGQTCLLSIFKGNVNAGEISCATLTHGVLSVVFCFPELHCVMQLYTLEACWGNLWKGNERVEIISKRLSSWESLQLPKQKQDNYLRGK